MKALGNITTQTYSYSVSVDNKFSFLERNPRGFTNEDLLQLKEEYLWSTNRIDTNNAYQLATQWLAGVKMDVAALNRDCRLSIRAWMPDGTNGSHFVPLYWVYWTKIKGERDSVASIQFFEPTKTIWQLRVEKPEYILRTRLEVTNLDFLLSQTNSPAKTNSTGK
jgi:hypothetical protein